MKQTARELANFEDSFLHDKRYLIMDRDTKFCKSFRTILKAADVKPVVLPSRSPNVNSHLERFFGSLKREMLHRMIFFGEKSLCNAVKQYLIHYHEERNQQGLENKLIAPGDEVGQIAGTIECRERLGGMLRYYHRNAAQRNHRSTQVRPCSRYALSGRSTCIHVGFSLAHHSCRPRFPLSTSSKSQLPKILSSFQYFDPTPSFP